MDTTERRSTAPSEDGPNSRHQLSNRQVAPDRPNVSARWAPWWAYLVVLLGSNYLRAALMPVGTVPEPVVVVIALGQAVVLFAVVTAGWRFIRRSRR